MIEVRMDLRGLPVTVLDTAGLRVSDDQVEVLGIARARERAEAADLRVILKGSGDDAPVMEPLKDDIVVVSKADVGKGDISAVTGQGLDLLVQRITATLSDRAALAGVATRERHRLAMIQANSSLGIALDRLETAPDLAELIAEDLRSAVRSLDVLVGRVDVESVLDDIFSSFCIGK